MIITNTQLRKVINEELQIVLLEQKMELWEQKTNRELDALLNEVDVMGALKGAGAKAKAALNKISDFAHTASVKAWQFMQKGKEMAIKGLQFLTGVANKIAKFCGERRKLCKWALGGVAFIMICGIMLVVSDSAVAAEVATAAADAATQTAPGAVDVLTNVGSEVGIRLTPDQMDVLIGAARSANTTLVDLDAPDAAAQLLDYINTVNKLRLEAVSPMGGGEVSNISWDQLTPQMLEIVDDGLSALIERPEQTEFFKSLGASARQAAVTTMEHLDVERMTRR